MAITPLPPSDDPKECLRRHCLMVSCLQGFAIVKDLDSVVQGGNDWSAWLGGLNCSYDLVGRRDHEFPVAISRHAEQFREQDLEVMKRGKVESLYLGSYRDERLYMVQYTKTLLRTASGEPYGIWCRGNTYPLKRWLELCHLLGVLPGEMTAREFLSDEPEALTPMLHACLFLMLYGHRTPEIADLLSRSPRTIEGYMAKLKDIFDCSSRPQLVEKAMSQGYLFKIPKVICQRVGLYGL